jgi:hypothetical protein
MSFGDVIEAIAKYPKMYLMHGSFGEALAYLDGYANGLPLGPKGRSGSFFGPFSVWLSRKLSLSGPGDFWQRFRDLYGDDETALREFAVFWRKYEAESESTSADTHL